MATIEELTQLACDVAQMKTRAEIYGLRQVTWSLDVAHAELVGAVLEAMEKELGAAAEIVEETEE